MSGQGAVSSQEWMMRSYATPSSSTREGVAVRLLQTAERQKDDDGSNQTQNTQNGSRGDGDGRCAARVGAADWARGSCHVVLRKRPRSHPL
jgi:hypothetical protein